MSVQIFKEGDTTTLLFDRSRRANAYDAALLDALDRAIAAVETPVAVVRSAGEGAFCAGADRGEMSAADPLDALALKSQAVFERLARAPWVSVAAVQGPAVGGGFELAMACDLRVAGPKARFWLPETGLGILPSAGGTSRLPSLIGRSRARAVILGGRVVSAQDALEWGLVDRISEDPAAEAARWAAEIARRDPVAQRLAKMVLEEELSISLQRERLAEALLYARLGFGHPPGQSPGG